MFRHKRFSRKPRLLMQIALTVVVCGAIPLASWIHQQQLKKHCTESSPLLGAAVAHHLAKEGDFVQAIKYQEMAIKRLENACNDLATMRRLVQQLESYRKLAHAS